MEIKKVSGSEFKSKIDAFYARYGMSARARDTDLFFLAFNQEEVIGSVRFCIEEDVAVLRSMMIADFARAKGLGFRLLQEFQAHLNSNKTVEAYCLPYAHLEKFYGKIGFKKIADDEAPKFLQERAVDYRAKGETTILMKRTGVKT